MINDLHSDIEAITSKLVELGLSIRQNYPKIVGREVLWGNYLGISNLLRRRSYLEIYEEIDSSVNYNVKLLDGALLQLMYQVDESGSRLSAHRLAYYPSPNLERYEDRLQEYEEEYFGDSEFHDMLEKYIVTFPLRFDYDEDETKHQDPDHPLAHLHLGQYENCRLPVSSPLTPWEFVSFILRTFYFTAFSEPLITPTRLRTSAFGDCITTMEQSLVHLRLRRSV